MDNLVVMSLNKYTKTTFFLKKSIILIFIRLMTYSNIILTR